MRSNTLPALISHFPNYNFRPRSHVPLIPRVSQPFLRAPDRRFYLWCLSFQIVTYILAAQVTCREKRIFVRAPKHLTRIDIPLFKLQLPPPQSRTANPPPLPAPPLRARSPLLPPRKTLLCPHARTPFLFWCFSFQIVTYVPPRR